MSKTTTASYWIKAGILSFLERFSNLLFGFGSFFLLIRMLSKEDFGVWVIFLTVTTILEVGKIGLLQNALVKFLTTAQGEDYKKISTASLWLNLLVAIFIAIFLAISAPYFGQLWNAPQLPPLLYIYALTTLSLILFQQSNFTQQANLDFRGIFWSNFVKQGLFFVYVLNLFLIPSWYHSLYQLAIVQAIAAVAGSLTSLWLGRQYLHFSRLLEWDLVNQLFQYGKYVMGTNLSAMLYKTIDKIMLGYLLTPVSVALYEAAVRVNSLVEVPTFSIASIVFPESARRTESSNNEEIATLYEKAVGVTLTLILPAILFVWLFGDWIIWIIAGEKYMDSVPLLRYTILYGFFVAFAIQFGTILDSVGRPRTNFLFTVLGATINIGVNYFMIKLIGVMGAPLGTLITYLITFILMQVALFRFYGVRTYRAFIYMVSFYKLALKTLKDTLIS